jgi:NTP pyrophosphatase (non-canonical NTP hydrolase)
MSLSELQEEIRNISGEFHKETVTSSAFFYALLMEQIGQCARKFMHQAEETEDIAEDVTDIIIACLCYLNWLGEDASKAWQRSFEKHKRNIQILAQAR